MYHEIEQLEREIVEFQTLVKESSEILSLLDSHTQNIEVLQTTLGENIGNVQAIEKKLVDTIHRLQQAETRLEAEIAEVKAEIGKVDSRLGSTITLLRSVDQKQEADLESMVARQSEIAALGRKTNGVLAAAILGILAGMAGIVMGFML